MKPLDGLATAEDLKAATEATRIFAAAAGDEADEKCWAQATRDVMRILIHCAAATRGYPAPELPVRNKPEPTTAACRLLAAIPVTSDWSAAELGPVYEHLLAARPGQARDKQGSWFTPPGVAEFMARFALDSQLDRLAKTDDPNDMLQVLAVDPACGAGVFLVMAARHIAARFAQRCFGTAVPQAVHVVMPDVLTKCVFGIDIDPIAVELSKAALWLEVGDTMPFDFMDRNIICGNALERDEPPKLTERLGRSARLNELAA